MPSGLALQAETMEALTPGPRSSAMSLPSSSPISPVSTGGRWRGFATVRNELASCFERMDSLERELIEKSSAARAG